VLQKIFSEWMRLKEKKRAFHPLLLLLFLIYRSPHFLTHFSLYISPLAGVFPFRRSSSSLHARAERLPLGAGQHRPLQSSGGGE